MAGPANASSDGDARFYRHPHKDWIKFPSVTSITKGGIPNPIIEKWKIKEIAEYAYDNALELAGKDRDTALRLIKNSPNTKRDNAGSRGTKVHEIIEGLVAGISPGWEAELYPWVYSGVKFIGDFDVEIEYSEVTVYSETHGYAGTFDWLGSVALGPRRVWVVGDWKTSKGVYEEFSLQMAAYRHADYMLIDGVETPMPKVEGAFVVHIREDDYDVYPMASGEVAFGYFLGALKVWELKNNPAAGLKGLPLPKPNPTQSAPSQIEMLRLLADQLTNDAHGFMMKVLDLKGIDLLANTHSTEQLKAAGEIVKAVKGDVWGYARTVLAETMDLAGVQDRSAFIASVLGHSMKDLVDAIDVLTAASTRTNTNRN